MPLKPVATADAFRFITVGATVVAAEQVGDNLTIAAGLNVSLTADETSDTVTINSGTGYGAVFANPDSANVSRYIPFMAGDSGIQDIYSDTDIYYNPSTNTLTTGNFSGNGANLTSLTAGNLTGTIPSAVLGNSNVYIGTTAIALNRTSASQTLNGVSIDGNAATATNATNANAATSATTSTNLAGGNNTTLLGSLPYQSNSNITSLLSPNTTTTKKFLRMTGDGVNGAAPAWDTIVAGDVPTLNQNTTGTASGLSGNQNANYFYAGPTTGGAATATWRAIVAGDIPTLNQNTTGTAAGLSGTQTQNYVYASPNGSSGTASFRALVSADIPTLNQNSTGSAASLSISGQTGLLTFTGLTITNRAKTVRDAADTVLELGGSYTPTGTWNWTSATVTWPTFNQNTTGSAASLSISGQTGLLTFTGLTSTNRAKTVRDAADTILELGGSYSPTGTFSGLIQGNNSTTTDADAIVDASTTTFFAYVQSASSTARTIQISNLTAGRRVYLYLRNTNAATKAITIQASTTTTSYANVALSGSFVGANAVGQISASVVTLAATTGTATVMVFNANATIGGCVV